MKKLLIISLILVSWISRAAETDTLKVFSPSMDKMIKTVVIIPDSYFENNNNYHTVYLLHGYGGDYASYIENIPELEYYADKLDFIIICPDGGNYWYFDSPVNKEVRYETFVSQELVSYVDSSYRSIAKKNSRAITGLSMGGHGALYLGIKHHDIFGLIGSMSGGVDIRLFPGNWEIDDVLGLYTEEPLNWENHTVINMAGQLEDLDVKIFIDCGTEDFFLDVNRNLHIKLLQQGTDHIYREYPGTHNWYYWRKAIKKQLMYFHNNFEK